MTTCWNKFVECIKNICRTCKPVIDKVITVGEDMLAKMISEKLAKYPGLDEGIKKAIQDSAKTLIKDGTQVGTKALEDWTTNHVNGAMKIVIQHDQNSSECTFAQLMAKSHYLDKFIPNANDNHHINQDIKVTGDINEGEGINNIHNDIKVLQQ